MTWWRDPINFVISWLRDLLAGWGASPELVTFVMSFLGAGILALGSLLWVIFLIWYERKMVGRIQDRLGPNRVGPFGLIQPFADMLKIFTKEYINPAGAEWLLFNLAPVAAVASVMLIWAVVPFMATVVGVDLNVGVLYIVAVGGLGTLGIFMAGFASNNKYALLGAFRVVAQLISYEVPMILSLLVPVMLAGTLSMNGLVKAQSSAWFLITAPVAAGVFFITSMAEVGRAPFDLFEAESEIVAGFNIEYSGLKFGMFYVGEFMHAFTISLLFATVFLGGWQGPGAETYPLLGFVYFAIKTFVAYFLVILMRYSLPRFRIDQMMAINWKMLTPVSLATVGVTALVAKLVQSSQVWVQTLALLGANLVLLVVYALIMRQVTAQLRRKRAAELEAHGIRLHNQHAV